MADFGISEALAVGSLVSAAGSAAAGVAGSLQQGQARQAAFQYQVQVAENNRKYAEWQAQDAIARGQATEQAQRMKTNALQGQQIAAAAAAGIDVNSGTPAELRSDTQLLGELDAATIRNNAAREAYGYRVRATGFQSEAEVATAAAKRSATEAWMGATASMVGGAASISDKWLRQWESGVWDAAPAKTPTSTDNYGAFDSRIWE